MQRMFYVCYAREFSNVRNKLCMLVDFRGGEGLQLTVPF